ncbi:acyl-CoA-binding domain-containing protein 4-like [Fundulus heteroclitus]|uniref:acyl-CoA-binding domain-containing protein 4-like n=1 Tax=Fundulus heteroclitus TaxID=8078 RepID=UPI000644D77B|nr:acyl-CoA-binding domain-containing protein 4 isoform X2 [Fundulus heteroclitus]XP_035997252.1 acyl-CoA-binding domain-containing protein 4-like [Fundulus heteroclitus]
MPVLAMAQPAMDHQRRFQAAVDVIHNLPKNGSYRPSYEVMLRFYSLYKQAVCGPCTVPRPGFWDPVGRYKWDAWSRLGEMSQESAMAAYVEEMKKVAQEVLHTMPMDEKTAQFFHHFEPLYRVIDDMPRPPASLLNLTEGAKDNQQVDTPTDLKIKGEQQEPSQKCLKPSDPDAELNMPDDAHLPTSIVPKVCDGVTLISDLESEIFCDSVDSVEQLSNVKSSPGQGTYLEGRLEGRRVGTGQGGEGADDGKCQGPPRRGRDSGQEGSYHSWRERGILQRSLWNGAPGGGGGGLGRGGGDRSEGAAERMHETYLQQQIILALQRLREDMRSVVDRLEVVERFATTHGSGWRPCLHCAAASQQDETCWPFDVSCQTVLLFMLWPFVTQGLVYLLRKAYQRTRTSS